MCRKDFLPLPQNETLSKAYAKRAILIPLSRLISAGIDQNPQST
jgi:hypothetical protein